jgi:HSP20 family molecular chaperone IbpA
MGKREGNMKSELFKNDDGRLIPDHKSLFNDNILDTIDTGFHLEEAEDHYLAQVAAHGMNKEDFNINVRNGVLYITGEHKEKDVTQDNDCYEESSMYKSFQQSFILPPNADENSIKATMEEGYLMIRIEKVGNTQRRAPLQSNNHKVEVKNKQEGAFDKIAGFFRRLFK